MIIGDGPTIKWATALPGKAIHEITRSEEFRTIRFFVQMKGRRNQKRDSASDEDKIISLLAENSLD